MTPGIDFDAMWQRRAEAIARLEAALRADERVVAAWLGGSAGRGTEDAFSDIDLHIVIEDDHRAAWWAGRDALVAVAGEAVGSLPASYDGHGDYQSYLLDGPLMLEFFTHPPSNPGREPDTRILFERQVISGAQPLSMTDDKRRADLQADLDVFWVIAPVALKYIVRGRTYRAIHQLDIRGGKVVHMWRLLYAPERLDAGGFNWLHPERDRELAALLPPLPPTITPQTALDAATNLMRVVECMHADMEPLGVTIPQDAVRVVWRFRDDVAGLLRSSQ